MSLSTRTAVGPVVAVGSVFAVSGFLFACFVARLPDIRASLDLSNGSLGLLLLAISVGSVFALLASGRLVDLFGSRAVVRIGCVLTLAGLIVAVFGTFVSASVFVAGVGFVAFGAGNGCWDVAMNVEAAEVERALGRTIMPRFHAGWSIGTFAGAGVGVLLTAADVPALAHLVVGAVLATAVAAIAAARFVDTAGQAAAQSASYSKARSAWTEPRTLAVGLLVLCFAAAEGAANDWLALALIDGYDARHWVGVAGFAVFVSAMTTGRVVGPVALDRFGRLSVLVGSSAIAILGVLLVVHGAVPAVVSVGIVLWGLGCALGFPVGMSAAADDPVGAARRVGVVATIGYGAFLTGPPLLGALGDAVGTLRSLLAVGAVLVVALFASFATRRVPR